MEQVSWAEFLAAIQSFTAQDARDAAVDEQAGSGPLGENIRLLLLAYGHRRHLQRQLGDAFAAEYYAGALGAERQSRTERYSRDAPSRRSMSGYVTDLHEAEAIAEAATDLHDTRTLDERTGSGNSSPAGRGSVGGRGSLRGGSPTRRVSVQEPKEESFTKGSRDGGSFNKSKRGSTVAFGHAPMDSANRRGSNGGERRRGSLMSIDGGGDGRMSGRRGSFYKALHHPDRPQLPDTLTTDEMLFARRGSDRSAELRGSISAAANGAAGGGGGGSTHRDWTGLPEDVAAAILGGGEEKQEKLLHVLDQTSADFETYLASRPEGWGQGTTDADRAAAARARQQRILQAEMDLHNARMYGVERPPSHYPAGPAVRGKLVGVHVGRRHARDTLADYIALPRRAPFGEDHLGSDLSARGGMRAPIPPTAPPPGTPSPRGSQGGATSPTEATDTLGTVAEAEEESDDEEEMHDPYNVYTAQTDAAREATLLPPSSPSRDRSFKSPRSTVSHAPRGAPPKAPPSGAAARRPLVPLAHVLGMLHDIESIAADADALSTAKRARAHALQQQRLHFGVLPEFADAVRVIHESICGPPEKMDERSALIPPPQAFLSTWRGGSKASYKPPTTARPSSVPAVPMMQGALDAPAGVSPRGPARVPSAPLRRRGAQTARDLSSTPARSVLERAGGASAR